VHGFAKAVLQVDLRQLRNPPPARSRDSTSSTTINIIPYAGHVNPGRDVFELLGGNRWHNWSSCKEVTDADFGDADLPERLEPSAPALHALVDRHDLDELGLVPEGRASILYAANDYQT
jgi:hypothetical protein